MRCSEFEIGLCDYLDGTLEAAARQELEQHAAQCPHCAALAADAGAFVKFLERVPAVEAPPELVTAILYRTQSAPSKLARVAGGWRRWFGPLLQPRIVMGMAMTILSFSMLSRVAGVKVRQLEAADLNPVTIWQGVNNQAHRVWDRGVKFYQNVRFIYEIMAQLRGSDEEEQGAGTGEQESPRAPEAGTGGSPPGPGN